MNTPTPTPRTAAHKRLWTKLFNLAHDEIFDDFEQSVHAAHQLFGSEAEAVLKQTAYLKAMVQDGTNAMKERDQLRAEVEHLKFLHQCESDSSVEAFARAERAEAIVGKLQELHGCSQEMVVHWCEHAANRSLGLDQARSELAAEREKSERYRLAALKLDAELAAERARLDWLLSYDGVDWILSAHKNRKLFEGESDNRALLEAAMKEDAK